MAVKIDTVFDLSDKALGELKTWLEPWWQQRCCVLDGAAESVPFFDAMMEVAATNDLRGYWRLGDGGFGPYADSKPTSSWANVPMVRIDNTVDMTDIDPGALPAADDDGAVQFNSSTGLTSDYLDGTNVWGPGVSNPFEAVTDLTVMGWVKPFASTSAFDGGIFSMLASTVGLNGYVLGVAWPSRSVFFETYSTRLSGPALTADEWVFVCAVHDATSNRIYLDGALVATGTSVGAASSTNINPKIGFWNSSSNQTLYGAIDEVSVWADALTDDEIALLAGSGGLATNPDVRSIISVVGAYTANPGETVFANGSFTVTLPTAVGNRGAEVDVKNIGAGTITVAQAGSETVDGSTVDLTLATKDAVLLVSDGAGWQIISSHSYP